METTFDYLIVDTGFFGSVLAERISRDLKKSVLIIDERSHIGGNCHSQKEKTTGIEYHTYGTHIFHTGSQKVYEYISQFTEFNGYYHQVLTTYRDKVFQMPINLETINSFFQVNLRPFEVNSFLEKKIKNEIYLSPQNLEEKAISLIGRELYEAFVKGYTQKQWSKEPKYLPPSIINRLPIRNNYNRSYFKNGRYQGIPLNGYSEIFEKMLNHPLITTRLNTNYFDIKEKIIPKEMTIYTGPIDRYFSYQLGKLEWRSVRFEREIIPHEDFQGTSVMNFAEYHIPYTRIHEPRHLHPERRHPTHQTLIIKEYPHSDEKAPYYPIHTENNKKLYSKYKDLASQEKQVVFGGRLGTYSYYDMDQVIAQALQSYETQIKRN